MSFVLPFVFFLPTLYFTYKFHAVPRMVVFRHVAVVEALAVAVDLDDRLEFHVRSSKHSISPTCVQYHTFVYTFVIVHRCPTVVSKRIV